MYAVYPSASTTPKEIMASKIYLFLIGFYTVWSVELELIDANRYVLFLQPDYSISFRKTTTQE